jgi:hypothetical protein
MLDTLDSAQRRALADQLLAEAAADEHQQRLRNDLPYFAEHALRLRPKIGPLEPFVFNAAQRKLHSIIEEQRNKTGRVRIVLLKARQLGISTYIGARLFHRTIYSPGWRTIIIGHEKRASTNLYQVVRRFWENMPDEIKPSVGVSNAEELIFDKQDSGYVVTVATSEGAGRSATAQGLHMSEVAFYPTLGEQMTALLQTVPDRDGTEVLIETTARGFNEFHSFWRRCEAGGTEFQPVFLPWSLDPEYRRKPDAGFTMTAEEKTLATAFKLDPEQLAWRRTKLAQIGADLFPQEYPLTPDSAFVASDFDSFIKPELVIAARKLTDVQPYGSLILGVDPASMGPDRTAIAWRRGHCIEKVVARKGLSTMETVGWVDQIIKKDNPVRVNIDVGGLGVGIVDRLYELGHRSWLVNAVNFGGKPVASTPLDETGREGGGPANRRAELWMNLRTALEGGRFKLPDSDTLQSDICSCGYKYASDGKLLIESKQDMRRRGVPSPDEADAVVLATDGYDGPPPGRIHSTGPIAYPVSGIY